MDSDKAVLLAVSMVILAAVVAIYTENAQTKQAGTSGIPIK